MASALAGFLATNEISGLAVGVRDPASIRSRGRASDRYVLGRATGMLDRAHGLFGQADPGLVHGLVDMIRPGGLEAQHMLFIERVGDDRAGEALGAQGLGRADLGCDIVHGQDHALHIRHPEPAPETGILDIGEKHVPACSDMPCNAIGVRVDADDTVELGYQLVIGGGPGPAHPENQNPGGAKVGRQFVTMHPPGFEALQPGFQPFEQPIRQAVEGGRDDEGQADGQGERDQPAREDGGRDDKAELAVGRQIRGGEEGGPCPKPEEQEAKEVKRALQGQH